MPQTPTETLTVRLPSATAAAFRAQVVQQGKNVNSALREAIAERLADAPTR